jgi:hypothetical protein
MKKILIGTKEYKLMDSLFDMGDQRFNVFKQHLLQTFESMDKPMFLVSYAKVLDYFNKGQHADGIIELNNFKKAIDLKELNYDAFSFCFCLLILSEGEDMNDTSEFTHIETKLKQFRDDGLTRGMVEEEVKNFMKASPEAFGVYLELLKMMKAPLSEDLLNELTASKES